MWLVDRIGVEADRHGVCPYMRSFRPSGSFYQTELAYFCFSIAECQRLKIIFVFSSQSVCGRKSFLFFHRRVSATENHFCFSVTECLRPEIIFVFSSQSVCGRKSLLFFHRRVSAAENHFCFSITGCLRLKIIFVFLSLGVKQRMPIRAEGPYVGTDPVSVPPPCQLGLPTA